MRRTRKSFCAVVFVALLSLCALPATAFGTTGDWTSFRGNSDNNAVVSNADVPTIADDAVEKWVEKIGDDAASSYMVGDPIIMDGALYIAVNNLDAAWSSISNVLYKLDAEGNVLAQADLPVALDYACRPLVIGSTLYVPLANGTLAAYDANLGLVWQKSVVPSDSNFHQLCSTLNECNGNILLGTTYWDGTWASHGVYLCIDTNGDNVWSFTASDSTGYYWNGAVVSESGGYVVFTGSNGHIISVNAADGTLVSDVALTTAVIDSTPIIDGSNIYVASKDAVLHKVPLNTDGTFGTEASVSFADSCTSTPALYNGNIYVGGGMSDYTGVFVVIEAATMTVVQTVQTVASVQSSPLVVDSGSGTFAYYTVNSTPGALYVLELGGASSTLYTPAAANQNYGLESPIVGVDGTLYYANDSGNLFAIAKKPVTPVPASSPTPQVPTTGDSLTLLFVAVGLLFFAAVAIAVARSRKNARS